MDDLLCLRVCRVWLLLDSGQFNGSCFGFKLWDIFEEMLGVANKNSGCLLSFRPF